MKKILSAVSIVTIMFATACGNSSNEEGGSYPASDSSINNNDTMSRGADGYAPPNMQDSSTNNTADSAQQR